MFEGEEEVGSSNLENFVRSNVNLTKIRCSLSF